MELSKVKLFPLREVIQIYSDTFSLTVNRKDLRVSDSVNGKTLSSNEFIISLSDSDFDKLKEIGIKEADL